MFSN
jgi:secreted Zn-dependent insulinase-like peptidase